MWKDWLRPFVRPLPQWSTVAVMSPQSVVRAVMRWHNAAADATRDHTVASLKPLVIASSIDGGTRPVLEYRDDVTNDVIGTLQLQRREVLAVEGTTVVLYDVIAGGHRCLHWPHRATNAWLQNRLMRKHPSGQHALMTPQAVQQLMIAYLCPRPVVLVSVATTDHANIFPMDLIGPLERSGWFTLGLRSTNVSADVMRASRRVALSQLPASMKAAAYAMSQHHRQSLEDWSALPFLVRPSPTLGIPAVADALRVDELEIADCREIGSHLFFLCRLTQGDQQRHDAQLHHTAGFHQAYRRRRGTALAEL